MPAAAVFGVLQASLFEWIYHRYWLHRPWLPPQMFTAHTLIHHQLCKHADTFHVHDEEQEEALSFQWWGGPVLVGINLLPYLALWAVFAPMRGGAVYGSIIATVGATIFVYYLAYEGFHYLMHKPSFPWIENAGFFKFIEHHHRLHHAHMGTNYNVVLPLADLLLGTLILKNPTPGQVTGPGARQVARRHSRYGRKLAAEAAATRDGAADAIAASPAMTESAHEELTTGA